MIFALPGDFFDNSIKKKGSGEAHQLTGSAIILYLRKLYLRVPQICLAYLTSGNNYAALQFRILVTYFMTENFVILC